MSYREVRVENYALAGKPEVLSLVVLDWWW